MRQFLFVGTMLSGVVCALSAQAAMLDFTPDPSRVVSDPAYLPMKKQIYGETGYVYGFSRTTSYDNVGAKTSAATNHNQNISQKLAYGVTDMLTVRADMSYSPMSKRDVHNLTTTRIRNADGFNNPNVGLTYRVLEQQKTAPVSVDVKLDYAPDVFDSELANNDSGTGTIARGGDMTRLGGQVSYKTKSFTIAGLAGVDYFGDRETEVQNTVTRYKEDSSWGGSLGLETQTRICERASVDLGASYSTSQNSDVTNTKTGVVGEKDSGDIGQLKMAVNYHVIPNRLVASLSYNYNIIGDSENTYVNPALNTTTESNTSNVFGVRLQYVFN